MGIVNNFRRRSHCLKQWPHEQSEGHGQNDGHTKSENKVGRKTFAHPGHVAGAETLRNDNGHPRGKTEHVADDEKHQTARATDRGQGLHTDRASDNDCIRNVVKLLEQIADQQGQRKQEDLPKGVPFGQVFDHVSDKFRKEVRLPPILATMSDSCIPLCIATEIATSK